MKAIEVVSFANETKPMLFNLVNSLEQYGYSYKIVGMNINWDNFMTKIKECLKYIRTLDPNKIVVVVDAYDVLAVRPVSEFISQFKSFNRNLVLGMESCCFSNCTKLNNPPSSKYKYVNGGFYAGYCHAVIHMYEYILRLGITDDQIGIGKYVNAYSQRVALDFNTKLVFNVTAYDVNELKYDSNEKLFYNSITKNKPFFIHMPGILLDNYSRANYIGSIVLGNRFIKQHGISPPPNINNISNSNNLNGNEANKYNSRTIVILYILFLLIIIFGFISVIYFYEF